MIADDFLEKSTLFNDAFGDHESLDNEFRNSEPSKKKISFVDVSQHDRSDLRFSNGEFKVKVNEDCLNGCGGRTWDSAICLSDFLIYQNKINGLFTLKNKSVLELGAGTGVVGLLAAQLGSRNVVLTDINKILPILKNNVELNYADNSRIKATIKVQQLFWGSPVAENLLNEKFDYVLASDCIYLEDCFDPLIKTLTELSFDTLIIAYKKRWKREKQFWIKLKKLFSVELIKEYPNFETFNTNRLGLYICKKKRL